MRTATWEVGDKVLNMKLTTSAIVDLEGKLGCNPLVIFGIDAPVIPTFKQMALVLQAAISYEKPISMSNVYSLIDEYFEEGHDLSDLSLIIADIYRASGLIAEAEEGEQEKN